MELQKNAPGSAIQGRLLITCLSSAGVKTQPNQAVCTATRDFAEGMKNIFGAELKTDSIELINPRQSD